MKSRVHYENKLIQYFTSYGYMCIRSAGSKGPVDLVAVDKSFVRFIQVKSTVALNRKGNVSVFCEAISQLAHLSMPETLTNMNMSMTTAYVTRELWVWVLRKGWHYMIVTDAPRHRAALIKYLKGKEWIIP